MADNEQMAKLVQKTLWGVENPDKDKENRILEAERAGYRRYTTGIHVSFDYSFMPEVGNQDSLAVSLALMEGMADQKMWKQGAAISHAKNQGMGAMIAYRTASASLGKSLKWVTQLCRVHETFPEEYRFVSVSWNTYKHVAFTTEYPLEVVVRAVLTGRTTTVTIQKVIEEIEQEKVDEYISKSHP